MLSNPFLRRGRSQETGRLPWLTSQDMIFRVNEMERNTRSKDSFVQRYLFNSSSFIACDIHLPIIRIKTHGEVPRVMQRATLMSIALTRTRTILVNNAGNPRVRQALPVPVPSHTLTRNPHGFPDKTSPRTSQTDEKWLRYA